MRFDTAGGDSLSALLAAPKHNPSMNQIRQAFCESGEVTDFCVPVNPYFPPPELLERLRQKLPDLLKHYPDYADVHQQHLAQLIDVPAQSIVVANGSTEIITALCRQANEANAGPMLTTIPTFGRWTDLPAEFGTEVHYVHHRRSHGWQVDIDELIAQARGVRAATIVICNPNNPTGAWFEAASVAKLVNGVGEQCTVIIDESFIEFSDLPSAKSLALERSNVIVVKSMGKSLGWHGIRLGYAIAQPARANAIRALLPWWNVNGLAAFVLSEMQNLRELYRQSFNKLARDRAYMHERLKAVEGARVYPSKANFLYFELPPGVSGATLRRKLLESHRIFVRDCGNKIGSDESYLRLAVLPWRDVDRLIDALQYWLARLRVP